MPTLSAFIVEDNPTILSNLIATLEELTDIEVVGSAPSEESAVRGLHAHADELDLVIVDLFLSAGTGLGVLEAAQRMQMRARRVVLSNFATPEVRRRCLALGAAEVFDKSRDLDALIDYCEKLAGV
jgi:DNA-binding NarL/FixJ family response regulator